MYKLKEHLHRQLFREDLRAKAKADVIKIAEYLKTRYAAEVFGIGSVFEEDRPYGPRSDIDLVVKGLPESRYFHILGEVSDMTNFHVDLIPYESANELIIEQTELEGRKL
jgi:predicted nucleotidyltransferase